MEAVMNGTAKPPTEREAWHLMLRMSNEGKPHADIAKALAASGYVSGITGRPIGVAAVSRRLVKSGIRRKRKNRPAKAAPAKAAPAKAAPAKAAQRDRLDAVAKILHCNMDPEERIALAILLIEGR